MGAPTPSRPLTERQGTALVLLAIMGSPTLRTEGSMPSLGRRGLAEQRSELCGGRRYKIWRITDAGRAEARRINAERRAEKKAAADEAGDPR